MFPQIDDVMLDGFELNPVVLRMTPITVEDVVGNFGVNFDGSSEGVGFCGVVLAGREEV